MMRKSITPAVSATLMILSVAPAYAQADHAQRIAEEVALRRAQVRALMVCEMHARPGTPVQPTTAEDAARRLPTYPPTGTGGPVRLKDCPPRR